MRISVLPISLLPLGLAVALAGTAVVAAEASAPGVQAPGRLVIVGGGLNTSRADVHRAVLEGREGGGPLCVIPTASGDPQRSMESAVASFAESAGPAGVEGVLLTRENPAAADDPDVAERLRGCSGYWFTGGDQSRIVDVFVPDGRPTAAYEAVRARHRAGAVVSGSSAGAAVMSRDMIAGGGSEDALLHGSRSEGEGKGVWLRRGLGFLQGPVVDQHFLARGRVGRLVAAVLEGAGSGVGLGIDENTALVVDGTRARVVGGSGVLLVDARGAERVGAGGRGVKGVRLRLLGEGDRLDLESLAVEVPDDKGRRARSDGPVAPPADPFARWAFLELLAGLSASPDSVVTIRLEGYRMRLAEAGGFEARAFDGPGVRDAPRGLSAGPWVLDLVPAG